MLLFPQNHFCRLENNLFRFHSCLIRFSFSTFKKTYIPWYMCICMTTNFCTTHIPKHTYALWTHLTVNIRIYSYKHLHQQSRAPFSQHLPKNHLKSYNHSTQMAHSTYLVLNLFQITSIYI